MNTVEVKKLSYGYHSGVVLDNINFTLNLGDFAVLVGHNGSGKTTLIKLILKLIKLQQGEIKLFGSRIDQFKDWQKIGYLPQNAGIFNPLFPVTVNEVVSWETISGRNFPKSITQDDRIRVKQSLEKFNIENLGEKKFNELSGGQQQKVLLARALVNNPELLILDEPTSALDTATRGIFFNMLDSLNRTHKLTILMVTHDLGFAGNYANRLLYLNKQLIFDGSFKNFCESKEMNDIFGGETQHMLCHQHTI